MITIYKTTHCPYCVMVARLLDHKKVAYKIVDITDNPKLRQKLVDKTGAMTVPITTDGKTYVVGWQPAKITELANNQ